MISDASLYSASRTVLSQSSPLTSSQSAALKTELVNDPTGRGYKMGGAMKPAADLFLLLNDPYAVSNPAAQERVPIPSFTQSEFTATFAPILVLFGQDTAPAAMRLYDTYNSLLTNLPRLETVKVAALGIFQSFISGGYADKAAVLLASLEEVPTGTTGQQLIGFLTTMLDPAWQPVVQHPSPASFICGIAEIADITLALGA